MTIRQIFARLLTLLVCTGGCSVLTFASETVFLDDDMDVIEGVVKDASGEPIIGAGVMIKGTRTGTFTDLDGTFSLEVENPESTILVISYIGFNDQEISLAGRNNLSVILEQSFDELDEVQVIAYGSQKKVTITGAISSVNNEELMKTPAASMGNALAGKMPGLTSIQYSGQPGADDPSLTIRGVGSFNGSSAPLVLVDGVERSFFQLDPNEVESVTILKDASATAVYGVRGANGVIIVTTKRGEEGKPKISFSTSGGVNLPTRLVDMVGSYEWATYFNEAQMNDGVLAEDVRFSPEILEAFRTHSSPILYPDTDWMDLILKSASFQHQHNVNVSGGVDRVRYYVSLGVLGQNGLFRSFQDKYDANYNYNRYNYRANVDFDLTKSTLLSINLGGRVERRNEPVTQSGGAQIFRVIHRSAPFTGAGIIDGKRVVSNPDYIPGLDDSNFQDGLKEFYGLGYRNSTRNVLEMDLSLLQKLDFITKGLSIKIKGSYNNNFTITKRFSESAPYYMPVMDNDRLEYRKFGSESDLTYSESRGANKNWYAEASVNYARKFGRHNVSALLLYNQSKTYYPATMTDIPTGYVGLVGRVTYDYATKYLVDFNLGYNGSENFAPDKRFGLFPAVSIGWIISEENFFKKQNVISYLKLRATYGVVGNDQIGGSRFMYLPDTYNFVNTGYYFGTTTSALQSGVEEGALNNPEVTWEKAYKQNYGIDMNMFKGRLKFVFDYFYEYRKDILLTRNNVPAYLAVTLPPVNFGIASNQGFEVSLSWEDKIGKKFNYYVSANLTHARSKIIEQDEVKQNYDYLYRTGHPIGQPFAYQFWGFYDDTAEERYRSEFGQDIATHFTSLQNGDCVYIDTNGDGVINSDDQVATGFTNRPEYTGGLTVGFTYSNFSFSMMWNYSWNVSRQLGDIFSRPMGATNTSAILQAHYDNRWTEATASTAKYPRASLMSAANNYVVSDLWIADASYLRLKNVEVSYRIKFPFLDKIGVSQFRVFANGYNLFTFDKLKVTDPEMRTGGVPDYPQVRIVNLGLKLSF